MNKKEIAPIIIGKLLNVGGMLQKKANQILKPFGLNQQQFSILFSISQEGRVNQKRMVNKLVLEKAHVSKVVKKLQSMGLVNVEVSKEDKRSSWLSITEKGRQTVSSCQQEIDLWNKNWTKEVDDGQLELILEGLAVIQKTFRNNT